MPPIGDIRKAGMRITRSSDWRSALPFETPMVADSVMPGDPARCTTCGVGADPLPRTALWAVKHRHPHDPAGTVRLYCAEHTPRTAAPAPVASPSRTAGATRAPRPQAERPVRQPARKVVEKPALICPDCFVEVPATGICGMCGQRMA